MTRSSKGLFMEVTFTITVENTGDVTLTDVAVSDAVAPNCDATFASLAFGASETYTCTAAAVTADFTNTADVVGTHPAGGTVTHRYAAEGVFAARGRLVVEVRPDLGFHDHGQPGSQPVEKAAHRARQVERRVNVEHVVAEALPHPGRARRREGGQVQVAVGPGVGQGPDQGLRGVHLAQRGGVNPDAPGAFRSPEEGEALAPAPQVCAVPDAPQGQVGQRRRSGEVEQQGIQNAH